MGLEYDLLVPRLCPGYSRAVEHFARQGMVSKTMLDLGMGSGRVAEKILERNPKLMFYGVDIDCDAILSAQRRLSKYHFEISCDNFKRFQFPSVDTIISSLSIHHLEHDEQESLLETISKNCNKFMHFELIAPENEFEGARIEQEFSAYLSRELKSVGLSEKDAKRLREQSDENDKPMKLSDHLKIHEKLGVKANVLFKEHCFAFYETSK